MVEKLPLYGRAQRKDKDSIQITMLPEVGSVCVTLNLYLDDVCCDPPKTINFYLSKDNKGWGDAGLRQLQKQLARAEKIARAKLAKMGKHV